MKFLRYMACVALCGGAMFAQTSTSQTSVGQPTDTNEPVYTGCLSGTHNNYFLISDDGRQFRLHSDKDINEHVGRRVEIRGTQKREKADRPANASNAVQEIDVADLKNVGQSCWSSSSASASTAGSGSTMAQPCNASAAPAAGAGVSASAGNTTASAGTATSVSSGTWQQTTDQSSLPQSDQGSKSSATMGDKQQTDLGDTNQPLFKGCVSGTKDNYTLQADNGDNYRLHSDKDINEHVGDRVEIRGTLKPEGGEQGKAVSGSNWKGELDVADIKTVAKGCAPKQ